MTVQYFSTDSPLGTLYLAADDRGLLSIDWTLVEGQEICNPEKDTGAAAKILKQAAEELEKYFSGSLKAFTVPLHLEGTDFQVSVWNQLLKIPYGETVSYGDIARRLGNPKAIRAVGTANGRNCIPIIVPCHRVINTGGGLGGYSGGLDKKTLLLKLENALLV